MKSNDISMIVEAGGRKSIFLKCHFDQRTHHLLPSGIWNVHRVKSYGTKARWAAAVNHKVHILWDKNRSPVVTIQYVWQIDLLERA